MGPHARRGRGCFSSPPPLPSPTLGFARAGGPHRPRGCRPPDPRFRPERPRPQTPDGLDGAPAVANARKGPCRAGTSHARRLRPDLETNPHNPTSDPAATGGCTGTARPRPTHPQADGPPAPRRAGGPSPYIRFGR
ncbi:hypothetical protein C4B68_32180 [Streptomyces dengpaensis]|uniref:Uncharacterized protein n=1 Tax=Streptomyces dengpaensis TaxID=2049881 RepID=A0ABM6SYD0_9ACTN|nr:hypothetical protein C4B68_32180 [Streptomyces dengpaensis]